MNKYSRILCSIGCLLGLVGFAHAGSTAEVRAGQVIDVQYSQPTQRQAYEQDNSYNRSYSTQSQRGYAGTAIGGAVGALLGTAAGRHSGVGRTMGGFGLGAIGAAIGNEVDQRRYERQTRQYSERDSRYSQSARYSQRAGGAQVIVQLEGGQAVAVYVTNPSGFNRGQKVWLIDNDQLIAAAQ